MSFSKIYIFWFTFATVLWIGFPFLAVTSGI